MSRLAKFWSLTRREKEFLFEASIVLLISNICVNTLAFRWIDRFLRTRWDSQIREHMDCAQEIRLIQCSISRAAHVLPWKSLCLSRSIAAFVMLRRRGIPAVMFAGVRFSDDLALDAHAWVNTGLEGNDRNSAFAPLIRIGTGTADRHSQAVSIYASSCPAANPSKTV